MISALPPMPCNPIAVLMVYKRLQLYTGKLRLPSGFHALSLTLLEQLSLTPISFHPSHTHIVYFLIFIVTPVLVQAFFASSVSVPFYIVKLREKERSCE